MEKALFNWPIVLQYDVKAKNRLLSRKFFGHEIFSAERSLNQPKATQVCIRSINQSNRLISVRFLFLLVRAFSFRGQTKIALYEESFSPIEGSLAYLSKTWRSEHARAPAVGLSYRAKGQRFSHINAR